MIKLKDVLGLEIHKYAPELNKLHLMNGEVFKTLRFLADAVDAVLVPCPADDSRELAGEQLHRRNRVLSAGSAHQNFCDQYG